MDFDERVNNLDVHINRGTLVRREWGDGYRRACLLAALSPEAASAESATACPADVIPPWIAALTPSMDDRGSAEAWPAFVRRYASVIRRAHVLDAVAWERARRNATIEILREAASHTANTAALASIAEVSDWLARGEPEDESEAVRESTARAAAWAAADATADAASAAYAAAWAAEATAATAARAAARAAADAARAAGSARAAARAAADAARAAWSASSA